MGGQLKVFFYLWGAQSRFQQWLVPLIFLASYSSSLSQVANNQIALRSALALDAPYTFSNTNNATVEWSCINKSLTEKCLVYHNDQWFQFDVASSGTYYLNLEIQNCREDRGIQALVIEGNPCEISSYKILQCISQIRGRDVFIQLDSVKEGIDYLINIDGFLGDFCKFGIQLSSEPQGLPVNRHALDEIDLSLDLTKNVASLYWTIPHSISEELDHFDIYKDGDKNHVLIKMEPLERNAIGVSKLEYTLVDSLSQFGTFTYDIIGVFKDKSRRTLAQKTIEFLSYKNLKKRAVIEVFLNYRNGSQIQMILLDKDRDQVLKQSSFTFRKKQDDTQQIDVENYLNLGISNFIVRTVNLETKEKRDFEFRFQKTND